MDYFDTACCALSQLTISYADPEDLEIALKEFRADAKNGLATTLFAVTTPTEGDIARLLRKRGFRNIAKFPARRTGRQKRRILKLWLKTFPTS